MGLRADLRLLYHMAVAPVEERPLEERLEALTGIRRTPTTIFASDCFMAARR